MDVTSVFESLHRTTDQQRKCSKCGEMHNRMRDHSTGELASYCFKCQAAYTREHRVKYEDMSPEAKRKANCRSAAKMALRRGNLKKKPCCVCGEPKAEMHHEDYSKPLDVTWLCRLCHVRYHVLRGDHCATVEHSARHTLDLKQVLDAVRKNRGVKDSVEHSGDVGP